MDDAELVRGYREIVKPLDMEQWNHCRATFVRINASDLIAQGSSMYATIGLIFSIL